MVVMSNDDGLTHDGGDAKGVQGLGEVAEECRGSTQKIEVVVAYKYGHQTWKNKKYLWLWLFFYAVGPWYRKRYLKCRVFSSLVDRHPCEVTLS